MGERLGDGARNPAIHLAIDIAALARMYMKRLPETAFAGITLLAGVVLFIIAPQYVSDWAFNIPGTTDVALTPSFFPRLAASVVAVASLLVLLTIPLRSEPLPIEQTSRAELARVVLGLTGISVYLIGVTLVGFVTSSVLFIIFGSWLGGYRRPIPLIVTAVITALAIRVVFRFGLNVNLPTGFLI